MPRNKILNFEEREKISEYKRLGMSNRKIASLINRSNSVVDSFIRMGDRYAKNRQRGRKARLAHMTKLRILCEVEKGKATSFQIKKNLQLDISARRIRQICRANKMGDLDATTTVSNENISEPCLEIKQSPPGSPLVEQMPARLHHDDTNEGYQSESYRTSLSNDQDEYDIFGTFVASELRGLNKDFSLVRTVKKKIQLALLDAYDNVGKTEIGKDFPPQVNNNIMNREPSRLIIMTPDKINTSCPQIQPNCVYLNYS